MPFQSKLKDLRPRKVQFQKRIKLLSHGFAKPDSFPNGEITVYPWDTEVDDWLFERMKKGDQHMVMYDMAAKVCDLNGCPLDTFVVGDVNTVLLVSRSLRYNSVIEYEAECPHCSFKSVEAIKVPEELGRIGEKTADYPGFDEIILKDCQDVIRIRPLRVRDERNIADRDETSRALMTDHVMRILTGIVAINEGEPSAWEEVLHWWNAISPRDCAFLEAEQKRLSPLLDSDIPHVCDRCRKKFTHTIEFGKDFFRSSLSPVPGNKVEANVRPGLEQRGAINTKPQ